MSKYTDGLAPVARRAVRANNACFCELSPEPWRPAFGKLVVVIIIATIVFLADGWRCQDSKGLARTGRVPHDFLGDDRGPRAAKPVHDVQFSLVARSPLRTRSATAESPAVAVPAGTGEPFFSQLSCGSDFMASDNKQ